MKSKPEIIAIVVGICWLVVAAVLPYRVLNSLFGVFGCCVGLMFLYSAIFGRHLSRRIRLGALIFGVGIVSLMAAHVAESIGLSWATPAFKERTFFFVFLPSCIPAGFWLPHRFSFFTSHDSDDKKPNA